MYESRPFFALSLGFVAYFLAAFSSSFTVFCMKFRIMFCHQHARVLRLYFVKISRAI